MAGEPFFTITPKKAERTFSAASAWDTMSLRISSNSLLVQPGQL